MEPLITLNSGVYGVLNLGSPFYKLPPPVFVKRGPLNSKNGDPELNPSNIKQQILRGPRFTNNHHQCL